MYDLGGKVALVTGAGGERRIGRAIANRLAQEGADIIVNDVAQNPYGQRPTGWEGLPDVVREIEALGRQAMGVQADVSDSAQVDNMVREGIGRFGHIDILVENAGSRPGRDRVPVYEAGGAGMGPSAAGQRQGNVPLLQSGVAGDDTPRTWGARSSSSPLMRENGVGHDSPLTAPPSSP